MAAKSSRVRRARRKREKKNPRRMDCGARPGSSMSARRAIIPKVTVITPTYNRPNFLGETIASVVAQSLQNWEMLVINDGGVDVAGLVAGFDDPRVRYLNRSPNRGKANCLNVALQKARGEYIAYLDDDDKWYPQHLQVLADTLDGDARYGAVYSDLYAVQYIWDEGRQRRIPLQKYIQVSRDFNRDFMFHTNHTLHVSLMHRRELAVRAGGYDEEIRVYIDWNITRKFCFYTDFKHVARVTGEYYIPVGKTDRLSNLGRADDQQFRHNLRKIKADLPPEPWPEVPSVAMVLAVEHWDSEFTDWLTAMIDHIHHPIRYLLINTDSTRSSADCRRALGAIGQLKNVAVQTPKKSMSPLAAYRWGARRTQARYLYLPTRRARPDLSFRIICALDQLNRRDCDGIKWDLDDEREGPYDLFIARKTFLKKSDPRRRELSAWVEHVPPMMPESLACDHLLIMAEQAHEQKRHREAHELVRQAEAVQEGGAAEPFVIDRLARYCFAYRNYAQAEEKCRELIQQGYGADNWIRLAQALQGQKRFEAALEAYERGLADIDLQPEDLDSPVFPIIVPVDFGVFTALMGIAECLIELGRLPQAARKLRRAARLKANSSRPAMAFARLFLKAGEPQQAAAALESARRRNASDPEGVFLEQEIARLGQCLRATPDRGVNQNLGAQ